ncbi:GNAT family N-acetyltransferase [Streptomyces sp. QH1-20]|uniref:GNAT family N-acetyltransferase n=1 Tax=Streptomyces sp. QH1-20 TaxID=3240934 RepID=UPI00351783A2
MKNTDQHTRAVPTPHDPARAHGRGHAPVYEMQPATQADRRAVSDLIADRILQLGEGARAGIETPGATVVELLGQTETGRPIVWLLREDSQLLGCIALLGSTPGHGWSAEQLAEPALSVIALFTDPRCRSQGLSRFMVWWALDYAARLGGVDWLRGVARSDRLMRYARDDMHCGGVETVLRGGRHVHLLQHSPRRTPSLAALIAETTPTA